MCTCLVAPKVSYRTSLSLLCNQRLLLISHILPMGMNWQLPKESAECIQKLYAGLQIIIVPFNRRGQHCYAGSYSLLPCYKLLSFLAESTQREWLLILLAWDTSGFYLLSPWYVYEISGKYHEAIPTAMSPVCRLYSSLCLMHQIGMVEEIGLPIVFRK